MYVADVDDGELSDAPGWLRPGCCSADNEGGVTVPFPLSAALGVDHGDGSVWRPKVWPWRLYRWGEENRGEGWRRLGKEKKGAS